MDTARDTRALRLARREKRGRRARRIARLLIPVLLMTFSAALWADPKMAAQLRQGLEVIAPLLSGDDTASQDDSVPGTEADAAQSSSLPKSQLPVLRLTGN